MSQRTTTRLFVVNFILPRYMFELDATTIEKSAPPIHHLFCMSYRQGARPRASLPESSFKVSNNGRRIYNNVLIRQVKSPVACKENMSLKCLGVALLVGCVFVFVSRPSSGSCSRLSDGPCRRSVHRDAYCSLGN
jgi:hypothetical protein